MTPSRLGGNWGGGAGGALGMALAAALTAAALAAPSGWLTVPSTNAVPNCGSVCNTQQHEKCVGALPSAAACLASCERAGGCAVWTWSESTKHCWHRTDTVWAPVHAAGITSGCDRAALGDICSSPPPPPPPAPVSPDVSVTLGAEGGQVSLHSPAVALDWWVKSDSKYGYQWGDASILVLDLQNPKLLALARALAPAVLRLGGSPIDSIEYAIGPAAEARCARGKGTPGGAPGNTCSQTGLATYGCFTGTRWRELLAFGKATGLRVVLGLNACNGRSSVNSTMDFSNIQSLLNFTVSLPPSELQPLAGFEFGNESESSSGPVHNPHFLTQIARCHAATSPSHGSHADAVGGGRQHAGGAHPQQLCCQGPQGAAAHRPRPL